MTQQGVLITPLAIGQQLIHEGIWLANQGEARILTTGLDIQVSMILRLKQVPPK